MIALIFIVLLVTISWGVAPFIFLPSPFKAVLWYTVPVLILFALYKVLSWLC